jgi:hypothetical protein
VSSEKTERENSTTIWKHKLSLAMEFGREEILDMDIDLYLFSKLDF